ncbi:hypothetical protein GOODEAATRI_012557, partial [Goodea atripinnis]
KFVDFRNYSLLPIVGKNLAKMDNSGKEKEAAALMAEAEKKLKSSQSFFGSLFGSSSKLEEACDMYVRAANMYKMAKNWCGKSAMILSSFFSVYVTMMTLLTYLLILSAAGNAFSKAAHLHLQMQSKHDAATNLIDAGNAFKKADPQGESSSCNTGWSAGKAYTDFYKLLCNV